MRVRTEAKRQAILEIAGALFLRDGYGAVSMARIASAVGGSKTTLYGYFPTKAEIFSAFVAETGEAVFRELETLDLSGLDLPAALILLGRTYLRLMLSPAATELQRVVIAEAGRFPELGRLFLESGRRQTIDRLARIMETLAVIHDRPSLASARAVAHFRGLVEADVYERRLLGGEIDIETDVPAAVACFLHGVT